MPDHLIFSRNMKGAEFDDKIRQTYLGQAHIAGTGPEGKTCRECAYWYAMKRSDPDARPYSPMVPSHPGYNSHRHATAPLEAKKAKCNRPIANKPSKPIPHHALACRLFVQEENVMPAKTDPPPPKPEKQKKPRKKAKKK